MARELTMTVTEFKSKCLGVLKKLEAGEIDRIRITRRGEPVGEVVRPRPAGGGAGGLFGCMKGLVLWGGGEELLQPLDVPEPEDPFIGRGASREPSAA